MPTLAQIARAFPDTSVKGNSEVMVTGATHDSRLVRPGFLFAAMAGDLTDGRRFIDDAIARGAVALLLDAQSPLDLPQIVAADSRMALGPISSACYSYPTRELALVGITGTNGKTTITYIVEAMLDKVGYHPGVMGTVAHRFKGRTWNDEHTTPEAPVIQSVVRAMVDEGASHMLMEVSSHGLALHRQEGEGRRVVHALSSGCPPPAVQSENVDTTVTASAPSITMVPGAVTKSLEPATATATAPTTTITPGAVTINLNPATATATAPNITISTGANIALQPATATATAKNLNAATATASAPNITVTNAQTINLGVATATASAPSVTFTPGAVTKNLQPATATASAPSVGVSAGATTAYKINGVLVA